MLQLRPRPHTKEAREKVLVRQANFLRRFGSESLTHEVSKRMSFELCARIAGLDNITTVRLWAFAHNLKPLFSSVGVG